MLLDGNRIEDAFKKIVQLQDHVKMYCLASDRPDLSVEEFQRVITDMYRLRIYKHQVPFEGTFLRGMMERYTDRVIIYVKKNMEEDWKRFATVKELCHVVNDEPEDWTTEGAETIKHLLAEYHINKDRLAMPTVQSENMAEISAIELLYPYKDRLSDLSALNGGKLTTAKIAGYYKIPEVIVAQALSDWYHDMAQSVWDIVRR